jgi:hypothetical protein
MIRLELRSLGLVEETSTFLVVLHAATESKVLLLEVGTPEGRAIAVESEEIKTPRPLTHQLTASLLEALGASLIHVLIHRYEESTFYSALNIRKVDGTVLEHECRPSDAIALALHVGAPIFVTEEVLAEAGQDEEEYEADIARIEELMDDLIDEDEEEFDPVTTEDGPTKAADGVAVAEAARAADPEEEQGPVRTLRWLTKRTIH